MEKVRIVKYALGIPFSYLKYAYVKSSLSNIDHLCGKLYFFCYGIFQYDKCILRIANTNIKRKCEIFMGWKNAHTCC